jgi:hypothetical protein
MYLNLQIHSLRSLVECLDHFRSRGFYVLSAEEEQHLQELKDELNALGKYPSSTATLKERRAHRDTKYTLAQQIHDLEQKKADLALEGSIRRDWQENIKARKISDELYGVDRSLPSLHIKNYLIPHGRTGTVHLAKGSTVADLKAYIAKHLDLLANIGVSFQPLPNRISVLKSSTQLKDDQLIDQFLDSRDNWGSYDLPLRVLISPFNSAAVQYSTVDVKPPMQNSKAP